MARKKRVVLAPAKQELLIKLYNDGLAISELMRRFDIGNTTVFAILKRNGVERGLRPHRRSQLNAMAKQAEACKKTTPQQEKDIERLYKMGLSQEEVAKHLNLKRHVISRVLVNKGITIRITQEYLRVLDPRREKEVIEKYRQGFSAREIAEDFGNIFEYKVVYAVLRRHGIRPRNSADAQRKFSKQGELSIVRDYLSGMSIAKMEEKYECHNNILYGVLKRHGIARTRTTPARKTRD